MSPIYLRHGLRQGEVWGGEVGGGGVVDLVQVQLALPEHPGPACVDIV